MRRINHFRLTSGLQRLYYTVQYKFYYIIGVKFHIYVSTSKIQIIRTSRTSSKLIGNMITSQAAISSFESIDMSVANKSSNVSKTSSKMQNIQKERLAFSHESCNMTQNLVSTL